MRKNIFTFQCQKTVECNNNNCFFRQRDIFGRPIWWHQVVSEEGMKKLKELNDKYGGATFPRFKVEIGTNCLEVFCYDFI